jgi:hypothetical protein
VVINGLLSLRDGILEHDGANKANVFDRDGALVHELTLVTDNGNELGGGKAQYREVLAEKLLAQGLIRDESQLKHRYTLSQTPSQAAFIERFNQTLRQKLRLAVQSELGSISQSRASEERVNMTNPKAWRALIARAVEANNNEVAAGTGMTPNDYMERFVQDGKQSEWLAMCSPSLTEAEIATNGLSCLVLSLGPWKTACIFDWSLTGSLCRRNSTRISILSDFRISCDTI